MYTPRERGWTIIEVLLVLALATTLTVVAVPATAHAIDALRAGAAARYLASRIQLNRMEALKRSARVALRFEPGSHDWEFRTYLDGNGNGVRLVDIQRGIDTPLTARERLRDNFAEVRFGLLPGIPDADGATGTGTDGIRIGSARILTMSPDGTATSGTLYLHGRHRQFAVRVFGVTGRTRVLVYDPGRRRWLSR